MAVPPASRVGPIRAAVVRLDVPHVHDDPFATRPFEHDLRSCGRSNAKLRTVSANLMTVLSVDALQLAGRVRAALVFPENLVGDRGFILALIAVVLPSFVKEIKT